MIQCVVIDDEPKAIENLCFALKNFDSLTVLKTFTNPKTAISFLLQNDVDLVFLDIEMPVMDGFQFLNEVQQLNFEVIITTAYSNYAIKAFKHNAIDYLLKPIDKDELKLTIDKSIERITNKTQNLENVFTALYRITNPKKIIIKSNGQLLFFESHEISYVSSDGNYSKIYLSDKSTLFITKKIKEVDALLPKPIFLRVHKSYVINIQKIKSLLVAENYAILDTNDKIPISKTYKNDLFEHL